ncbi:MAG: amidohydrolase [Chloroflexota bacterium]
MRQQQTTLFVNGNILTMDRTVPRVEALLVREGRIAALGPRQPVESQAPPSVRRVDLEGRTVVPGFHDAHCHILSFGLTLDQVDVSADSVTSIQDIQRSVGQRSQRTPPGEWVIGRGYDQNVLSDARHPTRSDLDEVAYGHPVVLWHTSGHALTCNSQALAIAGVHANTPTPHGGEIERSENGEPTGVLKEAATDLVSTAIPPPTLQQGGDAIVRAMELMASQGITNACDAATGHGDRVTPEIEMYRRALATGRLAGRITLSPQIQYVAPPDSDEVREHRDFYVGTDTDWLSVGATKIFADGALTTRTAAVREPYADTGGTGIMMWEPETLLSMMRRAHKAGWQIATHAIGDRAIEAVLDCYGDILSEAPRGDHRHRIEHCMMVDRDLGLRIQQLAVVPVVQPGFIGRLGDAYISALGLERASQLMPLELFDWLGITVAFSSDRPVIPGAPLKGIRSAMQRTSPTGVQLGRQHSITALEAIRYYTSASAFATHMEDRVGTLRRDAFADFVVLSHNPGDMSADDFARVRVEMTVAGGVVTYGD